MSHGKKAREIFEKGYSCAQSVLLAYSEEYGVDEKTAARISCGLGGGIARTRGLCGAVLGGIMVLGLVYSDGTADDKKDLYDIARKFMDEFKTEKDTYICSELLGLTDGEAQQAQAAPAARTKDYYETRPCAGLVEYAADILEKYIK